MAIFWFTNRRRGLEVGRPVDIYSPPPLIKKIDKNSFKTNSQKKLWAEKKNETFYLK